MTVPVCVGAFGSSAGVGSPKFLGATPLGVAVEGDAGAVGAGPGGGVGAPAGVAGIVVG